MRLDPEFLSRIQFAWVIGWHILLPAFTVGLASFIAFLEGAYALTKRAVFLNLSQFWLRIFAISFGMGVVTGIVMPFQFGTNWSRFSDVAANIISPLLAYEGLMAFFLEATFLGVLLFGRKLVPPAMHFVAAVLVAGGTLFSSFWILATNSWMQTPAGYKMIDGRFFPRDWIEIVFSPSFPYRRAHRQRLLRHDRLRRAGRRRLHGAARAIAERRPRDAAAGALVPRHLRAAADGARRHARPQHAEYQPAKLAAIEGLWDSGRGVPASIIGWPEQAGGTQYVEIAIPKLGSLYLTHSWNGEVKGLKDFPPDQRPPVAVLYFAFRIMVGIALLMLAIVLSASCCWRAGSSREALVSGALPVRHPLGFIAVIAGWTTTEVGRQPWTVYGLLRTADSVSPSLTGTDVLLSLLLYVAVYLIIYPVGLSAMLRLVWRGPPPRRTTRRRQRPAEIAHQALAPATAETAR